MTHSFPTNPRRVDMDPDVLDRATELLDELLETEKFPGIQVCVRRRGQIVLQSELGYYRPLDDESTWQPVDRDTRFLLFSISKCVTAIALHLLFDRDDIRVDDPVHWTIPEFAQHGKEHITLRHLLTHTAGIPMILWHVDDDLLRDWDRIIAEICGQETAHFPGRQVSYHILSSGYIIAEVIRRVTGKTIDQIVAESIAQPLGAEGFNFGLPETQFDRGATVERVDPMPPDWITRIISRLIDVDLADAFAIMNRRSLYDSVVPSGNIVATAEETSRFFQMLLNGGSYNDKQILSPGQVTRATGEQVLTSTDWTLFFTPQRYSLGFMLGREKSEFNVFGRGTEETFGHLGFTRQLAWANPQTDIAGCLLTNGLPIRIGKDAVLLRKFQNRLRDACLDT